MNNLNPTDIANYVSYAVAAAAAAAAVLPQAKPGTWWSTARTTIDWLAFNFGNASNHPKA